MRLDYVLLFIRLQHVASQDVAMQELRHVILQRSPGCKAEVPDEACSYFDFRDQMTVQDQLVFNSAVVVKSCLEGIGSRRPRDQQ